MKKVDLSKSWEHEVRHLQMQFLYSCIEQHYYGSFPTNLAVSLKYCFFLYYPFSSMWYADVIKFVIIFKCVWQNGFILFSKYAVEH